MPRQPLSRTEVDARLAGIPGWTLADGKLCRTFAFSDFIEAFGFMASAALVAQQLDHHPDWHNVYNRVEIALWTHDAGGLTELDFRLAAKLSELAA